MSKKKEETAEFIPFEEFRNGLPHGRFRVIVDPKKAVPYVSYRVHVNPIAVGFIGAGIAIALSGQAIPGGLLVAAGIVLRRVVRWQAGRILLHLASRQSAAYYDATSHGVMEVRRAA